MANPSLNVGFDAKELTDALKTFGKMDKSLADKKVKSVLRKHAKPMLATMKATAPTADNDNIEKNLAITTAKKRTAGMTSVRVGVVKNNTTNLERFSAPALASVIEYGSVERYRQIKSRLGIVTGRVSTGRVKPKRFLRNAYDRHEAGIIRNTRTEILNLVDKASGS